MSTFHEITSKMPSAVRSVLQQLPETAVEKAEEIRMRSGHQIAVRIGTQEKKLEYITSATELQQILNHLIQFSYYAYEEDLAKGFVTIQGGHRAGICGKVVVRQGQPVMMREISSLNLRFAREVRGCCRKILPEILRKGIPDNTLIVSPPGCGKTTLLRDIARELSENRFQVAVCDERSEIAGMYQGYPGFDMGPRCDVLDGCEKAWGIPMLIRSMAPHVIITDEIGKPDDVPAAQQCLTSGVSLITSIHGTSLEEIQRSPAGVLVEQGIFQTIIFLTNRGGPGTVREVIHYA